MNATKFTFDTVFGPKGGIVSDGSLARKKKALTLAEIEEIEQKARIEGEQAGEVRAQEQLAQSVHALDNAIREALAQTATDVEAVRKEAADLAFAAARKLARSALAAAPLGEVEAALREAMHQAISEPRIVLRVTPEIADAISAHIENIALDEAYDGRVQIKPDPHLHDADCRIEWRGGGTERLQSVIEESLSELIERRFSGGVQTELSKE